MTDKVLEVAGAKKSYGETAALDGADLALARGEWLGLLGPNGAGKTTLVRAIAGRVRLNAGEIRVLGQVVTAGGAEAARMRAKLGIVPQEIALYPLLTAKENLEVFANLSGLAGEKRAGRIEWALEFTGLAQRADSRVDTFSGGMKRRLNIACSVLHEPEIILLDEPTVGVDPQSRERIWQMLSELRAGGASLLLTSHQLDEVERVCERIVIIDHGQVVASGTVGELIAKTIGTGRRVTMVLDGMVVAESLGAEFELDGTRAVCTIENVAAELPGVFTRVAGAGGVIRELSIETPTLQSVFIHLTGRELRE